ncbi:MAG: helix-turn-helix transcriptional regulator [Treponema sp.]|nr:helix-turn-helix transcriptional regulator [Treponema sp.]
MKNTKIAVLTSREQEILDLLLEGISPKDIAFKLNVSHRTVAFHRSNIYVKLDVQSIQELFAKFGSQERRSLAAIKSAEKNKLLIYLIPVSIIALLYFGFFILFNNTRSPVPLVTEKNPLVLTFYDNRGYNPPDGWQYMMTPPLFLENKINEGDSYTFNYTFISNVDFSLFQFYLLDKTIEADNYFTPLCPYTYMRIRVNGKANGEENGIVTVIATKSSSSSDPFANLFVMDFISDTEIPPVLTFTRFEIIKNN